MAKELIITKNIYNQGLHTDGRPGLFFFRGERIQCQISCITRSKGGRRASGRLSTKEERLSTRISAARLTTSLRLFLADHFFRFKKKEPRPAIEDIQSIKPFRPFDIVKSTRLFTNQPFIHLTKVTMTEKI
jgi:hypothetical protein